MSTEDTDLRREAIRTTLAHRAGSADDANAIADATIDTWTLVAAQLAPVVGARGVDVLFARALHQTSTAFPWVGIAGNGGASAAPLAGLRARIAGQEAAVAAEASSVLLLTFTQLLATLIGAPLAERLLSPVWVAGVPASEKEIE